MDVLDRAWLGWTDFVRATVAHGGVKTKPPKILEHTQINRRKPPGLKTSLKPANNVRLKRDLKEIRRPRPKFERAQEMQQLKRTNVQITDENMRRRPKTAEEELVRRVDPPKPFDIDEKYLETPDERTERVTRIEKQKKKVPDRFARPPMSKLKTFIILEPWHPEPQGSPSGFRERY